MNTAFSGMKPNQWTRQAICLTLATGFALCSGSETNAQRFKLFSRKSDDNQSVQLTDQAGPWLIMCASFDGVDGQAQAERLARELRDDFRLKAYVYRQTFDIERRIQKKGMGYRKSQEGDLDEVHNLPMKLAKGPIKDEYAVLIGDFPSVDNAKAQRVLEQVKQLQPKSLQRFSQAIDDSAMSGARLRAQSDALFADRNDTDWTTLNNRALTTSEPLHFAFLLPNPMLPEEYFAANQIDDYVIKLNQGPEYSLLTNPGNYTLRVATFIGKAYIQEKDIEKMSKSGPSSTLVECAKRADILTKYLRQKGFEAYQYHDRYESIVCVGSLDWWARKEGGTDVVNPEALKLLGAFAGRESSKFNGHWDGFVLPGRLIDAGIACDNSPLPIAVPKVNVRSAGLGILRR